MSSRAQHAARARNSKSGGTLLTGLTPTQQEAVTHPEGPLLIIAGAGTGKTTVITRRIAWLISTGRATPDQILALTFTEKAAAEMEERVDVAVPYGYLNIAIATFHAFGDRLLRDHAVEAGLLPGTRVLSKGEQIVFLRKRLFDLPFETLRPLQDPARYVESLISMISRAKDEAVTPEEFLAFAKTDAGQEGHARELARIYEAYQQLLRRDNAIDFGDQMLLAIQLFERHPELLEQYRARFRYILVDEFQDTNYAQFRLLELLATPTSNVTVVADDDQSIYKWRGAAISNVVKFLEHYRVVKRVVLVENFRSSQPILDCAYRLIRFNDPNRLEVTEQIDKRLIAMQARPAVEPKLAVFDTGSSEADWVARQIQSQVEAGTRRPGDFAILVRSNREAELFLRALNVAGLPWQFSGTSGLFAREEIKMLISCLKTLSDPEDSVSWYHVVSSALYLCPMADLMQCLAAAKRTNLSLRLVFEQLLKGERAELDISEEARRIIERFMEDVQSLLALSRTFSPGQLLYRWLTSTGWLKRYAGADATQAQEDGLRSVAKFFDHLYRFEHATGNRLPELMESLEFFQAIGDAPHEEADSALSDCVNVLTIHKAKGLEFSVVFLVGLVQGRFPTPMRRDALELPEPLIKDILPSGDYHLQEERRLFYVGLTRPREELYLTAAYDYGGRTVRKLSQFVLEALNLSTVSPRAIIPTPQEQIERVRPPRPVAPPEPSALPEPLRLDPHGADDYVTCPWKFRYSHVLRVPILRHHLVIYGAALHKAIEVFFRRRLQSSQPMSEEELVQTFEAAWSSEGFLSREHERLRLEQGRRVLHRFYEQQLASPDTPSLIEEKFSFHVDDFLVVGRWDRVDETPDETVIIDYKSSDVTEQTKANRRTRESLQMAVYALAWKETRGRVPDRLELRFLETGLIGQIEPTGEMLEKTKDQLRQVAAGIRALDFHAQPSDIACRWCAYQAICPFSAV